MSRNITLVDAIDQIRARTNIRGPEEPTIAGNATFGGTEWGRKIAALTVALGKTPTKHTLRPAACQWVQKTDVRTMPSEAPTLLRGPWLLEVANPKTDRLCFGYTLALAGYPEGNALQLVATHWPNSISIARWTPEWTGGEVTEPVGLDTHPLVRNLLGKEEDARELVRFVVTYALLLDTKNTPLTQRVEAPKKRAPLPWRTIHTLAGRDTRLHQESKEEGFRGEPLGCIGFVSKDASGWHYQDEITRRRWVTSTRTK